ncbi:hypothetical protein M3J09_006445 [Ascochyta lentis]
MTNELHTMMNVKVICGAKLVRVDIASGKHLRSRRVGFTVS